MACNFCNKKNEKKFFPGPVIEINNPESLVLFRKVVIPASMGDETAFPPINGKYHNVLLHYDINGHNYIYSSDGIPTLIETEIPKEMYDRLDTLDREMAAEVEARTAADIAIEAEIEEIKNSPDVVDIVATYAALQAYDTSHLGNKDVIRVLADETHDGQSAYYRWDKPNSAWSFIGTVGDYYTTTQVDNLLATKADKTSTYTKTETDTLLGTKQDTLTAGSNVTISDNTISATDTTYSDFVGAGSGTAGQAGLVPAPASGDTTKFLKSDGTWAVVSQYSLPPATTSTLGGVMVGGGLTIQNDGTLATDTFTTNEWNALWA